MHRVVGVEKEPVTRSQSFRSRVLIIFVTLVLGWDVLSKLFGLDTSLTAGRVSCDLQFLHWPATFLSPQRYSAFIAERCASGNVNGVVPVIALLTKFSLAILFTFTMWASLWFDRKTPRWVIARAERRALQNGVAKPLTESGFILRRVMMGLGATGMIVAGYVIVFAPPPEQVPTSFIMMIFASSGFIFAGIVFAAVSVWLSLLVKR